MHEAMGVNGYMNLFDSLELTGANDLSRDYHAIEKATDRQVSIVVFYKNLPQNQKLQIPLPDLDFPGLATIFDIVEDDDFIVIPEEIVGPGDLVSVLLPTPYVTEKKVAEIANCILRSLQYLHRHNIIDRNIKFQNILLSDDPSYPYKLKDYLLAKLFDERNSLDGCVAETFPAPEIIHQMPYGKPADVWSLGSLLYILLCGKPPYFLDIDTTKQILDTHVVDYETGVWQHISDGAKEFLQKMLRVNPEERATVDQLLEHSWVQGECPDEPLEEAVGDLQITLMGIRLRRAISAAKSAHVFKKFIRRDDKEE